MNNSLLIGAVILLTSVFNISCGQTESKVQVIKPAHFLELMKADNNTVVLDVRTPEEFKSGALDKAVNIDFYEPDFADQLAKLDKDKTYLIYCRSGKRSNKAAYMLLEKGFKNVADLDGGIISWEEAGMPVKK